MTIDLNADLGEGFGIWRLGDDDAMLDLVTSANVACGFHAGDPAGLARACRSAAARNVRIGAQVGYRDLAGFGRRFMDVSAEDLLADVVYQMHGTEEAKKAEAMLELLTPICKGFMTDVGFESANLGMQVLGGHGYIREHGMEQLARDGRILQQYEGANGIQSLDLLGRKVLANGGATLRVFTDQIDAFCAQNENKPEMKDFVAELTKHSKEWHELVTDILNRAIKNPDEAGSSSYDFMSYSGYVVFAFMFARMAAISIAKVAAGTPEADFYKAKMYTARFYFERILPRTRGLVVSMKSSASNVMDLADAHFAF